LIWISFEKLDTRIYAMKVLVTGATGFKGAWLMTILNRMGHDVHGIGLGQGPDDVYLDILGSPLAKNISLLDITKWRDLSKYYRHMEPELTFHLAAQPFVGRAHDHPFETYQSNVVGTFNVLLSTLGTNSKSAVVATTDKVYKNQDGEAKSYKETDELGGFEAYGLSKVMADQLASNWSSLGLGVKTAIVRAGNVVGGGDRGEQRLMPDIVRAITNGAPIAIRNAKAVRPWQHVLDCLAGYCAAAKNLSVDEGATYNFGPPHSDSALNVSQVIDVFTNTLGRRPQITTVSGSFRESAFLSLDSTKSREQLDWVPLYNSTEAIQLAANWEKRYLAGEEPASITLDQVGDYLDQNPSAFNLE
jgi:CDP-glucose 4,6-dehydratase